MMRSFPLSYEELLERVPHIERALGYGFHNKKLLIEAFIHGSFLNEQKPKLNLKSNEASPLASNERLEFLGDAILSALVSHFLFKHFKDKDEGELSHLRSQIVDMATCAQNVTMLGIENSLLMGRGQRLEPSLISQQADLFEAILGAVYLDGGWQSAEKFFFDHFQHIVEKRCENPERNWKGELQDFTQRTRRLSPSYEVLSQEGPDHTKIFEVGVFLGKELLATGLGNSKKAAQSEAAKSALQKLESDANNSLEGS